MILLRRLLLLALLATLSVIAYGTLIEPRRLVVTRRTLDIPRWPSALSGLRLGLLADFHIGSPHWDLARLRELVRVMNAERPDVILLAGDYRIHEIPFGHFVPHADVARELRELRAPLGVFMVLGNHDGWHDRTVQAAYRDRAPLRLLEDEVACVDARGARFCVLGVQDEEIRKRTGAQALALAPPGVPLLVLTHEPDFFAELDARASLTLAGHTHGGQVRLPIVGAPIVRSRHGYLAGHIIENGRHLFVTTGLGTSVLPIRLGVPPELVVLTLR